MNTGRLVRNNTGSPRPFTHVWAETRSVKDDLDFERGVEALFLFFAPFGDAC